MNTARMWLKLYRRCLLLYPSEYRSEYCVGMERVFVERLSDLLNKRRTFALVTFLFRELLSVARTALVERLRAKRPVHRTEAGALPKDNSGSSVTQRIRHALRRFRTNLMDVVTQDLRHAIRMLIREPGFTVAAVLTLALGIGACTTVFSVVNAVLLRPLPYESPERLVLVWETGEDYSHGPVAAQTFLDWRTQNRVFGRIVAAAPEYADLTGGEEPERVNSVLVTAGLFELFGVHPALGRGFLAEEESPERHRVVVLSHGLWLRRF